MRKLFSIITVILIAVLLMILPLVSGCSNVTVSGKILKHNVYCEDNDECLRKMSVTCSDGYNSIKSTYVKKIEYYCNSNYNEN